MGFPTQKFSICRADPGSPCESCERVARFVLHYNLLGAEDELVLCDEHLLDVVSSDQALQAALLKSMLAEMLQDGRTLTLA